MKAVELVSGAVFFATLTFAPLWFGAVQPWAWAGLFVALALVLLARGAIEGLASGGVALPDAPLLVGATAVGLLVGLQQVPLPAVIADALSPRAGEAVEAIAPGLPWKVLSLDRPATFEALLLGGLYLAAFAIASAISRVPRHAKWILLLLVSVGAFEAFYGLVEQLGGDPKIFGYAKPVGGRVSGTYVNPNHYAAFLAMAACAALGLAAGTEVDDRPRPRDWRLRLIVAVTHPAFPRRALLLFLALAMGVALAGSLSRGGVLTALVGVGAVGLGTVRVARGGAVGRGAWVLVGLLMGVGWLSSVGVQALLVRFQDLKEADVSVAGRLAFASDTILMAFAHPATGVGAGAFEATYPRFQSVDLHGLRLTHAHSDYAELLAELGFVGFVVLVGSIFLTAWRAWPPRDEQGDPERRGIAVTALGALAPIALHSFVDFNLRIPGNALWAATLLGVAWGVSQPERVRRVLLPASRGMRAVALGGVVGAVLVLVTGAVQLARADWIAEPFVERAQGDTRPIGQRIRAYEQALAVWPFSADHHEALARYRFDAALERRRARAKETARGLVDPERTLERELEQLAQILLQAQIDADPTWPGDVAECLAGLERAAVLVPGSERLADSRREMLRAVPAIVDQR